MLKGVEAAMLFNERYLYGHWVAPKTASRDDAAPAIQMALGSRSAAGFP
jgi:hypothetical protein